jgi:DAK2 domain fusion protein YloV
MVVGAATMLDNHKEALNALNVFPVPDGDTGTNMSLTMISAAKEVMAAGKTGYKDVVTALSVGSLKGARGNSGVILSQIWRGFSNVLGGIEGEISARDIASAMQEGTESAYRAIMKPKEGTILTVIRTMADAADDFSKENEDILDLIHHVLSEGETVLKKTPDMLPVLKEAGVVDAGGAGLIIIFKGFKKVLAGEKIESTGPLDLETEIEVQADVHDAAAANIEFGYCTEFFIKGIYEHILERDIDAFRQELSKLGDSLLVVGDLDLVKVHVHTNDPGIVLQTALTIGELSQIKIDNMREQHRHLIVEDEKQKERKSMSVVSVVSGDGLKEIFKDSLIDEFVEGGQTMNPSTQDILSVIDGAPSENVIVLPNNKNIILAAQQAAELSEKNVVVVPTKTLPQGISAALAYNCEEDFKTNVARMQKAPGNVKTGQVTVAVRDSGINGGQIKRGEWIGIGEGEILANGRDILDVSMQLLEGLVDEDTGVIAVYYGEDADEAEAEKLAKRITQKYEYCDVELHWGGQSVYNYLFAVE